MSRSGFCATAMPPPTSATHNAAPSMIRDFAIRVVLLLNGKIQDLSHKNPTKIGWEKWAATVPANSGGDVARERAYSEKFRRAMNYRERRRRKCQGVA